MSEKLSKVQKSPKTPSAAKKSKSPTPFDDIKPLFLSPRKRKLMGGWFFKTSVSERTKFTGLAAVIKNKLNLTVDSKALKLKGKDLDELAKQHGVSESDDEGEGVEADALLADIQESAAGTSSNHLTRYIKQIAGSLSRIAASQESLVKQNAAQSLRQNIAAVSRAGLSHDDVEAMKLSKTDLAKVATNKKKSAKAAITKKTTKKSKGNVAVEEEEEDILDEEEGDEEDEEDQNNADEDDQSGGFDTY